MTIDPTYVAVVGVAFVVAGVVKGAAGMGLPPTAIALMTLALPLPEALALMTVPTLATNLWQAVYGGHFRAMLRRFWLMGVLMAAGVLVSARALKSLGSPTSAGWLGVLLVLFAILALTAWRPHVAARHEPWANPLCGAASGLVGGITGIAAVPFLPYMQSLEIRKDELVQALGILFVVFTGALTLALWDVGALHKGNLASSALATLPTMAGVWLGQKLRLAISPEAFRRVFLVVLLGLGLHMAKGLL
ncbi:sulfite exporter TauE/SafE family protein [Vineibacter terrae]|uniref:sulfite exporter TauE/SafE family protein n=1 Tax=Vineibacter terrae TaxID=2586908 RepID=UPI002E3477BC|nr:sulfite exporter TauE/SafE family protein [Vineibacter terrae]HEX2889604.1 sulfite exporter TauE/SafE family protein [Vineibacter terrae]